MLKVARVRFRPAVKVAVTLAPVAVALGVAAAPGTAQAAEVGAGRPVALGTDVSSTAASHWQSCNASAVSWAPQKLWERIEAATEDNKGIPASFWTTQAYRQDIVKIVCYESTFAYRAENGGQYGWFQMSSPLIGSEGVTFYDYWNGDSAQPAGWYQCTAGERYILRRYGTPAAAWQHEADYGWY